MDGAASGGTLETIIEHASHPLLFVKSTLGFNPLLKMPGTNNESKNVFTSSLQWLLSYSSIHSAWVGFMPGALCNLEIVRRSNAILNFGENFHYEESLVYKNFFEGFIATSALPVAATVFFLGPLFSFFRNYVLPKPGEGPSREV